MHNLAKFFRYLLNSDYRFFINARHGKYSEIPDEIYLKKLYKIRTGRELNLETPRLYTEKLQWLKMHDRNPRYTRMVDKYEVKQLVAEIIGERYVIPLLGVWNSFDEIDFQSLPQQFVLKCTHDSGGLVICKEKNSLDFNRARKRINSSLRRDYYSYGREWPYRFVKPRIIAEKYMEDSTTHDLKDFKFFCFNGEVKALFVATERQNPNDEVRFDFFDESFNHLEITNGHKNALVPPAKPQCFVEMKRLAKILSQGIPHVRVDFYEVDGKVYFGEFTFSHFCGFVPFSPDKWNSIFGDWINLGMVKEYPPLTDVTV